jgi:hypothetical protein
MRKAARTLLTQAVEAEVSEFLAKHTDLKTPDGDRRIMHQGGLPEREVMVSVRSPRASRVCAIVRRLPAIPIAFASRLRSFRHTHGAQRVWRC